MKFLIAGVFGIFVFVMFLVAVDLKPPVENDHPFLIGTMKSKIGDSAMAMRWFKEGGIERESIEFIYETEGSGLTNLVARTRLEPLVKRGSNGWEIRFREPVK